MQDRLLREGAYYCNVAQKQELPPDPHTLLDYPPLPQSQEGSFGAPLLEGLPRQHEIFVIDALLIVERTNGEEIECYLSDYPPLLIQRGGDARIKLDLSEEVKERLANRSALALGWHPYCRVLGQLSSFEALERSVAPLLISLREPLQVSGTIASELREEWDHLQVEENQFALSTENPLEEQNMARKIMVGHFEETIKRRKILRKEDDPSDRESLIQEITTDALAENYDFGDLEYDDLSQIKIRLATVQAFENSGMSGPLAFLIGFYFFLGIHGQESRATWAREIAAKLLADWPVEEWRKQFEYLRPAEVLRLDENGLELITSVLEGK
jgi:hypothetical protein